MIRILDILSKCTLRCACALILFVPVASADSFTVLYALGRGGEHGANPNGGLVRDSAGNLYGTTLLGIYGTVYKLNPDGVETVLHRFGGAGDGGYPFAGLIKDGAGDLYGTTSGGGTNAHGTVFEVSSDGTETILYSFTGGSDGSYPYARLIRDRMGNFYSTTEYGGAYASGTAFELTPNGNESTLYSFCAQSNCTDGAHSQARLELDGGGNLYGTTVDGGAYGYGTIFKLARNGTETVLHSFTGEDGANPLAGLIADKRGTLYGTTEHGGGGCGDIGCGVVFVLTADGTETVLYAFTGGVDGAYPYADLVSDKAGNLYGTTRNGGGAPKCDHNSCGTVFKIAPDGTETVLHAFAGKSDGKYPVAGLITDNEGNLYGTASEGGSKFGGGGTIFTLHK